MWRTPFRLFKNRYCFQGAALALALVGAKPGALALVKAAELELALVPVLLAPSNL